MQLHTVTSYQKELNELQALSVKTGNLIIEMLEILSLAMKQPGKDYYPQAKKTDYEINKNDEKIEHLATIVLATRQPLAIDLRFVLSSIKLAVIMERMGDLCKNIIKRFSSLTSNIIQEIIEDITPMHQQLIFMMKKLIECFKNQQENQALSIIAEDAKIDALYSVLVNKISHMKITKMKTMEDAIQMVMACKNIERMGDYMAKLAKILYYINTGKKLS